MSNLELTNKQYYNLLLKIRNTVDDLNFKPYCYDSITIGDKFTKSNCGLCNEDYTELETALFPDDFKKYGRKSRKYRKKNHKCPFDLRFGTDGKDFTDYGWGCFYHCFLFGNGIEFKELGKNKDDIYFIRKLVNETIKGYEELKQDMKILKERR